MESPNAESLSESLPLRMKGGARAYTRYTTISTSWRQSRAKRERARRNENIPPSSMVTNDAGVPTSQCPHSRGGLSEAPYIIHNDQQRGFSRAADNNYKTTKWRVIVGRERSREKRSWRRLDLARLHGVHRGINNE